MGIFRAIKRKSKAKTIKLCPNCEQPTIFRTAIGEFTNIDYYKCKNCDYRGSFFIEVEVPPENPPLERAQDSTENSDDQ